MRVGPSRASRTRDDGDKALASSTNDVATCDCCGARTLEWRKCKLICTTCSQINKTCADL